MTPEPDNLLESDRIEDVLEDEQPAPPVVVVQDRSRVLPWLMAVGAIAVLTLGSAYAYHRREVARLRIQAELARRDLQRAIEQARAEENELRLAALPTPPAAVPVEVAAVTAPAPAANGPAATLPPASAAESKSPGDPPAADPKASATAPEPASPGPRAPALRPPRVLDHIPENAGPVGPPLPSPAAPAQPAMAPPAIAAAGAAEGTSPFDELNVEDGRVRPPARVNVGTAPASAPVPAADPPKRDAQKPAAPPAADPLPADPPLPSREETERQIRAEAAEIGRDNVEKQQQQREDLRSLRDGERRQFIDELRMILKTQGRMAGPEIERLTDRSGRSGDPAMLMRARVIIAESRASQHTKVRRLREAGVPETVILDYLANGVHRRTLGTRNGPRTSDEVWIQAANILLRYYDQDARPSAAAPAATPQGRTTTPASTPGGTPRAR